MSDLRGPESAQPQTGREASSQARLAQIYLDSGALGDAEKAARLALERDPGDSYAAVLLSESLILLGRSDEAKWYRGQVIPSSDPRLAAQIRLLDARIMLSEGMFAHCI